MPRKESYLNYIKPLLVGLFLLAGWLAAQLWKADMREQELFRIAVTAPSAQSGASAPSGSFLRAGRSGEFSEAGLEQIDYLPGLRRRWAIYCADVELCIDKYRTSAQLYGVELSEYPLTIIKSAGERQTGTRPLLIAGDGLFNSLSDEYGNLISKRQAEILREQIGSLAVCLDVRGVAGAGEGVPAGGGEEDSLPGGEGTDRSQAAGFLGIAGEDGLYMDADLMKRWLAQLELPCEIRRVELEIRGERNLQKAQENLEKAGLSVERLDSSSDALNPSIFFVPSGDHF